jgi:hypothetical protein
VRMSRDREMGEARVRGLARLAALGAVVWLCWMGGTGGCQPEEKVLRYKPFLANVPGAQTRMPTVGPKYEGFRDPTAVPDDKVVRQNPDGSVTLVAKSIRQLMILVQKTLAEDRDDLLYEQVVSEEAKQQYRDKGKEPLEILAYLKEHRQDISTLFSRMPFGEQSPNVILDQPGNRTFHLKLTGLATKGSNFHHLWAIMEHGTWKLLWVE